MPLRHWSHPHLKEAGESPPLFVLVPSTECLDAYLGATFGGAQQLPQNSTGSRCRFTRFSKEKTLRKRFAGTWDMLDAIQISLALWAMIVCGGIKLGQVVHCLF
ncbi:hypothetical protein [Bradyrhizobium sp. 25ACV]